MKNELEIVRELGNQLLRNYCPDVNHDVSQISKRTIRETLLFSIVDRWKISFEFLPSEERLYRAFRYGEVSSALKEKMALLLCAAIDPAAAPKMNKEYMAIAARQQIQSLPYWLRFVRTMEIKNSTNHSSQQDFEKILKTIDSKKFVRTQHEYWIKAAEKTNELPKRIEIYKEALLELPDNVKLLQNLSCAYYEAGRYVEMQSCELHALKLYPENADLNSNHGLYLHIVKQDYDEAEKYFKKAFRLQSEHVNNNAHYAWFLDSVRKDYKAAEYQYKVALKVNPENTVALHNYGAFLCFIKFDAQRGISCLEKANALCPNHATILGNLALALTTYEMDLTLAEKYFQIATDLDPSNPMKHSNHAQLLFVAGKKREALKSVELTRKYAGGSMELLLEVEFYLFAHCPEAIEKSYKSIQHFLANGLTDEYKNFSVNIKHAIKHGHPDVKTLLKLAERISGFKYSSEGQMMFHKRTSST